VSAVRAEAGHRASRSPRTMASLGCNYLCMAPAMMVLPLLAISVVNTFVAGPPLETLVFDSKHAVGPMPYMQTAVSNSKVDVGVQPKGAMSNYFVFTAVPSATGAEQPPVKATVMGWSEPGGEEKRQLATASSPATKAEPYGLQLLQPLVGLTNYSITVELDKGASGDLPAMELRLTYVPPRFSSTQTAVRLFFSACTVLLIAAYVTSMCMHADEGMEAGQGWILAILCLLLGVNDPFYPARVAMLGSVPLEMAATLLQILFSATLFLFWLIMADGMQRAGAKTFCGFYCLKGALVGLYAASACALFGMYGRVPDRLEVAALSRADPATTALAGALIVSLGCICLWLAVLVARLTSHLGWKNVEYIYTDREKSFVGMTVVFMLLWVCGLVYRAVHGQRGSWLMLQLPFLALSNSYLVLLAHAFWPGSNSTFSATMAASQVASEHHDLEREADEPEHRQGLLSGGDED